MSTWRHKVFGRIAIAGLVYVSGAAFDKATEDLPNTREAMLLYHGGAAVVDATLFKLTRYFARGFLRRDVEAIFIASSATNALGWALYMARTPPFLYDHMIAGLNYALAIRLLMGDGNVFSRIDLFNWRGFIRRAIPGYQNHAAKEEKR